MATVQTKDLIGAALDWLVAKCEGEVLSQSSLVFQIKEHGCLQRPHMGNWKPSSLWVQGGPIIEREAHNLFKHNGGTEWCCACNVQRDGYVAIVTADGPTPLIAAMRCFVASKLGTTVEVPEELAP